MNVSVGRDGVVTLLKPGLSHPNDSDKILEAYAGIMSSVEVLESKKQQIRTGSANATQHRFGGSFYQFILNM